MKQISKKCLQCNKVFFQQGTCSKKAWLTRKYCSQKCAGLAWRGHPAPKSAFKKGQIPWNKGKSPSAETIERMRIANNAKKLLGKKHPNWKGDKAGYGAIHSWVVRHKGKPQKCIDCGVTKEEKWLHWANIDHKYRRYLDDYVALCPRCHKKHDLENGLCIH